MDRPNKNVARGEATRGQSISIARRLFAERGYEDTSIEAVLRVVGLTVGSVPTSRAKKPCSRRWPKTSRPAWGSRPSPSREVPVRTGGSAAGRLPRLDQARRRIRSSSGSC